MITHIVEGIDGARQARGSVVIIDVMRDFTTAAYAFSAGSVEINLVATVEEALSLSGFRMGEVGGRLALDFGMKVECQGERWTARPVSAAANI